MISISGWPAIALFAVVEMLVRPPRKRAVAERTAGRYLPDGHPAKPGKGKTATVEPAPTG
jgi:hypothetical protein